MDSTKRDNNENEIRFYVVPVRSTETMPSAGEIDSLACPPGTVPFNGPAMRRIQHPAPSLLSHPKTIESRPYYSYGGIEPSDPFLEFGYSIVGDHPSSYDEIFNTEIKQRTHSTSSNNE